MTVFRADVTSHAAACLLDDARPLHGSVVLERVRPPMRSLRPSASPESLGRSQRGEPPQEAQTVRASRALLAMLQETLRNLDEEHRERLARARRTSRNPALEAGIAASLARRHAERRAPYMDAIARLSATKTSETA